MKRECDDKQLKKWIRQIAGGDTEALVLLYDALFDALCLFVLTFLGGYNEAEDVVQETFIRVYQNAGQFEGKSSAKTWIFSIAKNLCLDVLKKPRVDELSEGLMEMSDIFSELESAEVLSCLDEKERQVIVLRIFGGFQIGEIAILLCLTERQISYCQKQAYQKLKAYYAENH